MKTIALLLAMLCGAQLAHAAAQIPIEDEPGARDHPLIKRYEGSLIVNYDSKGYDELTAPLSVLVRTQARDSHNNYIVEAAQKLELEGPYTRLIYLVPEGRSPLEVLRNYQGEITANGGEILYECKNDTCGGALHGNAGGGNLQSLMMVLYPQDRIVAPVGTNARCATTVDLSEQRYAVGKLAKGDTEAVIAVLTYVPRPVRFSTSGCGKAFTERTFAMVLVLESKAREQKMLAVEVKGADEMQAAIADTGRIALYGIFFDFDEADIKPNSEPALKEIAKLLNEDQDLNVLIVGHTDNVGEYEYNVKLSEQRARAVVESLESEYGIDAARMRPAGAGRMSPHTSNADEEGPALNRRVELVKF